MLSGIVIFVVTTVTNHFRCLPRHHYCIAPLSVTAIITFGIIGATIIAMIIAGYHCSNRPVLLPLLSLRLVRFCVLSFRPFAPDLSNCNFSGLFVGFLFTVCGPPF